MHATAENSNIDKSPDIQLDQVTLAYGNGLLMENLCIEFPKSSFCCLLGPSGVGKSTLLRYIAGLSGPEILSGTISTSDGRPLTDRIGWLPQEPLLLPWLNVLDNVCIGARLRKQNLSTATDRAIDILKNVGLGDELKRFPAELSRGMQSRTALARTLLEDKPVVLMDEPFAAIDAITRNSLQTLATQTLAGRTVVLVTHDPYEALRVGDRIHVLNGRPARISDALIPSGKPPRDSDLARMSEMHAELMRSLSRGMSQ